MNPAPDAQKSTPHSASHLKTGAILTALGIVFGDIGSSPLYVFQAITKSAGGRFDDSKALGSLSLILWTLIIVVTVKYNTFGFDFRSWQAFDL